MLYLLNKGSSWRPRAADKLALRQELEPVVKAYCRLTRFEPLHMDADQQPINYLATSIMTNLKVNVQEHFMQGSGARNAFFARLSWIKGLCLSEDVPTEEEYASLSDLEQELLDDILTILLPVAVAHAEPVAYLVDAMVFFPAYCRLSRLYEYHGYPLFQAINLIHPVSICFIMAALSMKIGVGLRLNNATNSECEVDVAPVCDLPLA
ncbi:hypothetical protein SeLEV6574_g00338 [Synchytrium endobioticum]|uniref:Uncharacterized protein n=1 Tax=Synchytrium endobioticum TaxID=286115 RepID=A0A507DIF7_9FUNG|nr:hypothetical protein SeLEV6574_g00338 [Synchytrium endobioticum]